MQKMNRIKIGNQVQEFKTKLANAIDSVQNHGFFFCVLNPTNTFQNEQKLSICCQSDQEDLLLLTSGSGSFLLNKYFFPTHMNRRCLDHNHIHIQ